MESIDTALFLNTTNSTAVRYPAWWNDFQLSFDQSLIVDRHFLSALQSLVGIASIDESAWYATTTTTTIETLRLILAQKFESHQLNFRELPVSLLRLYFSGQNRLRRFITRLPHTKLNALVYLLHQDGLSLPFDVCPSTDPYTDTLHQQKCLGVERYLTTLLDYVFCSFERTLQQFMSLSSPPHRFGLDDALKKDSYWANFPVPSCPKRILWLTCVWRMNATILLCKLLSPWDDDAGREWLTYQCKLFRDTHLDLLSAMLKHGVYDDEKVAIQLLHANYPLCNRVCCAEELPDFVGYATDHFKMGSNLKERFTLDDKIGHIFVGKTGPNICKIRNFYDIIIRYGEEDPIIYELLKNVIKCVLLGNLPNSRGSLNVMARIKINLSFAREETDAEIPEDVFRHLTKNKSMKRTRSKKKTKDELIYTKTKFKLWLLLCRHFVLYLLKEFLFYIAESSHWFNEILSVDYKFTCYRQIVLLGNGRCRKKLSQQAKLRGVGEAFDWNVIEFEEKSTDTYDIKSGEIKKFHAWCLTKARKIQKDDFMKILAKKMTNTEESIGLSSTYRPFYYVAGNGEEASPECVISLEDLHFLCWYMAKRKEKNKDHLLETRWFLLMGMSMAGLCELRMWYFMYSKYDIPDNSLKEIIKEFHANSTKDYMILKTVLRLIDYYKHDQVFHLPLAYAKKQVYALRNLLGVEDWESTPPLLGFAYQCNGCHKFANPIIDPTLTATTVAVPSPVLANGGESASEKKRGGKRHAVAALASNTMLASTNNNNLTSCFLNTALYNMDDGRLYCSKYTSGYKHALLENDNYDEGQIVMRKKDGSVIVRSNKTVLLFPSSRSSPPPSITTGRTMSSVREREEKKFQWLLDVRAFELNETDDVACGLFAANKEEETSGDGSTIATVVAVPTPLPKAATIPKKSNKKIILGYVNRAISDMNLTCNTELTCIDMIGIVKNLKVLCVECGSMTEMKNHNVTNHGITCGRHKSIHDSDFASTLSKLEKRVVHNTTTTTTVNVGYYPQRATNHMIRNQLHPLDMVTKCTEPEQCAYCDVSTAKYRIAGVGHHRAIIKIALCKSCYTLCNSLLSKHQLCTMADIYRHLRTKKILINK